MVTRDQQEVMGYYDTLQIILDHYRDIAVSKRYIHQLHGVLLKYSGKDQSYKGRYKSISNQVVANYPDGSHKVIFRTTEPSLTDKEMEELFFWLEDRFKLKDIHPVLVVSTFIYEFLSIHPYQDGNGRLSRLLTTLLLMQQGYEFVQYISFEHIIEERKESYYRALMNGQKDRYSEKEQISEWVLFFLDCMVTLIKRLEAKYKMYSQLSKSLNDRQKLLLDFIELKQTIGIGAIVLAFPYFSRNTIKKDISYLLNEGLILKTGKLKGTKYHFPK